MTSVFAEVEKLKDITARLLYSRFDNDCRLAAGELHALFSDITQIFDDSVKPEEATDTLLGEGTALSPKDAARCIFDFVRTRGFLRGVRGAIIEARRRFPGQTIQVLYAGCGPFAPLMIPLLPEFTPDQVQFTLLDIHQRSLDAAREILERLGLSGFVRQFVQADAAAYQHPRDSELHVVVTETMQRALAKEPQLAITANLAGQLAAGGILVPERIWLNLWIANLNHEVGFSCVTTVESESPHNGRSRIDLGKVIELNAVNAGDFKSWKSLNGDNGARQSPPITLTVPEMNGNAGALMVTTEITVFDDVVIRDYECGLTYPMLINNIGPVESGAKLEFRYVTGEHPGLRYRLV
jgi:hypothetical protein